jgi:hypothetical protein
VNRGWFLLMFLLTACGGGAGGKPPSSSGGAETTAAPDRDGDGIADSDDKLDPFSEAQYELEDASGAFTAAAGDCVKLCKALGSMTRATERLCELAKGSSDEQRCTEAQSKLEDARAKVNASCGGCG